MAVPILQPLEERPGSEFFADVKNVKSPKPPAPFEVEPLPLKRFIKDGLKNPPLSEVQFHAVRHLEQVYLPATYDVLVENAYAKEDRPLWVPVRMVNFGTLQWGKGSGKDHICRILLARWVYLMMCLKSPQDYWGMPEQEYIHFLNVAASATQASRAFFASFRALVKNAPVFKGRYEAREGIEPGKFSIVFDGQLEAVSGHSGSASQEGLNLLGGIADEISTFRTKDEADRTSRTTGREPEKTAEAIIKMMKTSSRSRFPKTFKNVYISFPRFLDDAIQQLTAQGRLDHERKGDDSRWYVSGPHATWDVNPRVPDKADFAEDYETDRASAEAMYECRPGRATNRAFRNDVAIAASFARRPDVPTLRPTYVWGVEEDQGEGAPEGRPGWQVRYEFGPELVPFRGANYALHADMAVTGDRAGIAMAHIWKWQLGEWSGHRGSVRELRPLVKVDFAIGLESDTSVEPVPREIQIRWFRKLVWTLNTRGFYIASVTMDGWQSLDSLQSLASRGIEATRLSCDVPQTPVWKTLQDVMYEGRLDGPYDELLITELRSLRKLSNGKIDHPDGGCFVGETRIPLLDGTFPTIAELDGKGAWVYSARPDGSFVPGWARGRQTKFTKHLVDVVLDNGYVARCTPEHLWMLRDGTYRPAQDLRPGEDRLMPLNTVRNVRGGWKGYTEVGRRDGERLLAHRLVAEWKVGRPLEPDEVVHHLNHLKSDNRPENLAVMTRDAHRAYHAKENHKDPNYREALYGGLRAFNRLPATREKRRQMMLGRSREDYVRSAERTERYRSDITMERLGEVAGVAENANMAAKMLGCGRNVVIVRLRKAGFSSWEEFVGVTNHRVVAVIPVELDDPVPVYDLEVAEWSNFALTGGVVVHNSKDIADAVAGAVHGALEAGGRGEGDQPERVSDAAYDLFGSATPSRSSLMPEGMGSLGIERPDMTLSF